MRYDRLRHILLSAKKPHILVIGDVILDEFIWGEVTRISPEAPVQVVSVRRQSTALGGAANVANNLAAVGCEVTILGVIGADERGSALQHALKEKRINDDALFVDRSRPTTTKTRIIAGNQHVVRIDREVTEPASAALQDSIVEYLAAHMKRFDALIVSDYQKGMLTDRVLHEALGLAKQCGIKSIVDPKRRDLSSYDQASLIKPNLKEAEAIVGRDLRTEAEVLKAALEILDRHPIEAVLITRGKDGHAARGPERLRQHRRDRPGSV